MSLSSARKWLLNPANRQRQLETTRRWEKLNPDKVARYQRNQKLKKKYGLTFDDVEQMKAAQNNLCAICQQPKDLYVDHCHTTGVVRGLLCWRCNLSLAGVEHFKKDDLMIIVDKYLKGYCIALLPSED